MPLESIIEASTPSPDVPLIKPKEVYFFCIFLFIYNNFCIIVVQTNCAMKNKFLIPILSMLLLTALSGCSSNLTESTVCPSVKFVDGLDRMTFFKGSLKSKPSNRLFSSQMRGLGVECDFSRDGANIEASFKIVSRWADIILVIPTTANLMTKLTIGKAEDLATTVLLASNKDILLVPAMNVRMWLHKATQKNLKILRIFWLVVFESIMIPT